MRILKADAKGEFGRWLRAERVALGLSQRELASKLGCTYQAVSLWETGNRVPSIFVAKQVEQLIKDLKQQSESMNGALPQVSQDEAVSQFNLPTEDDALCDVFRRLTELRKKGFDMLNEGSYRELSSYMRYLLFKQEGF